MILSKYRSLDTLKKMLNKPSVFTISSTAARIKPAKKYSTYSKIGQLFTIELMRDAYLHRKPVIWTNIFVPSELVFGLGGVPFQPEVAAAVSSRVGQAQHGLQTADTFWVSRDTCSFLRCAFGLDNSEILPEPDALIVSNQVCDGVKRMFQQISENKKIPLYFLNVPYYNGEEAQKYLLFQLEELVSFLEEEFSGLDRSGLAEALRFSNAARKSCIDTAQIRKENPSVWSGNSSLNTVGFFFQSFGSKLGMKFYMQLVEDLNKKSKEQNSRNRDLRLLWLHLKPYYPNRLFEILDKKNTVISIEEYGYPFWEELDAEAPLKSLAGKMLANPHWGKISRRVNLNLKLAEEFEVDGAVQFGHWGCRQSQGAEQILRDAFADKGIPFLNLDGDGVDETNYFEKQALLRLEAFLELLEHRRWAGYAGSGN